MESSSMPKALAEAMAASAFSTLKRPAMPMRQLSCRPLCRVVKAKPGSAFSMFVSVQFSSRLSPSLLPKVMTRCAWARARSSTRCAWSHVAVDDGDFAVLHQLQLAGKIVLKVGVLQRADVVLSDVENIPRSKSTPYTRSSLYAWEETSIVKKGRPLSRVLRKVPLQVRGLGGSQVRLVLLGAGVHLDGGEHRTLLACSSGWLRQQASRICFHKVGGGGLALGSGQADQPKFL